MTSLAELRLHLRDEHSRTGQAINRFKHRATTYSTPSLRQQSDSVASPTTGDPQCQVPPESFDAQIDEEPDTNTNEARDESSAEPTITDIIGQLISNSDDAELDEEFLPLIEKLKIKELFEFSNDHWLNVMKNVAMRGLQEELELYELVDLDAEGVPNDDPELDSMTAAVMLQT